MIRQNLRQAKEPRFAALLNRSTLNSLTPSKRRESESQYDVNQSRRPEANRNPSSDRLAASPLKGPLKKAIEKTVRNMSNKENEMGGLRRTQSRVSRKYDTDEDLDTIVEQMHSETQNFLWKYFDPARFHQISMGKFVDKIMIEYQNLWNSQQSEEILEPFIDKLVWCIGGDQIDWVDMKLLQMESEEAGIIGLILKIFKQLKYQGERSISKPQSYHTLKQSFQEQLQQSSDIQNLKNIVQQFMESMYKCMENQVYAKFNVEMRRMVLRYKESEKLLKIVNDKITNNIDIFTNDQRHNDRIKQLEGEVEMYRELQLQHDMALNKERDESRYYKGANEKLLEEVRRLNDELNRIQSYNVRAEHSILQPRGSTVSYVDPLLSRHTSQPHIYTPSVIQQIEKSVVKNTYSDFYEAPLTTTTIQNTSSILPTIIPMEVSTYPSLVSVTQPEIKVQVIQQKEYITTSPSKSVIRTETIPVSPSRLTISRLEASPIRSRVVQIL